MFHLHHSFFPNSSATDTVRRTVRWMSYHPLIQNFTRASLTLRYVYQTQWNLILTTFPLPSNSNHSVYTRHHSTDYFSILHDLSTAIVMLINKFPASACSPYLLPSTPVSTQFFSIISHASLELQTLPSHASKISNYFTLSRSLSLHPSLTLLVAYLKAHSFSHSFSTSTQRLSALLSCSRLLNHHLYADNNQLFISMHLKALSLQLVNFMIQSLTSHLGWP